VLGLTAEKPIVIIESQLAGLIVVGRLRPLIAKPVPCASSLEVLNKIARMERRYKCFI
jgi:hypothetical protein